MEMFLSNIAATQFVRKPIVPRSNRNAFAFVLVDSRRDDSVDGGLDQQKRRLVQAAEACGFLIKRTWMFDIADCPDDRIDPPREWRHAGILAASQRRTLVVNFACDRPMLEELLAFWIDRGVKVLDLEMLEREQETLRAWNSSWPRAPRSAAGGTSGREHASDRPRRPRNMSNASRAAAKTHAQASRIRAREFAKWEVRARADGAESPQDIADWLNAHGVRNARGKPWTRVNVQRMLNQARAPYSQFSSSRRRSRTAIAGPGSVDDGLRRLGVSRRLAKSEASTMQAAPWAKRGRKHFHRGRFAQNQSSQ